MAIATIIHQNKKQVAFFDGMPTISELLTNQGMLMPHPCNGNGTCGKCLVEAYGELNPLYKEGPTAPYYLSCQTRLTGDATIYLQAKNDLQIETLPNLPQSSTSKNVGAAVDIGTTTVVLAIYDLQSGTLLGVQSCLNPQISFATDVIGRIEYSLKGFLDIMSQSINNCILDLAKDSGYVNQIDKWVITGNTTMLYLLTKTNTSPLSVYPFTAEELFGHEIPFHRKPLYLPRCMSAFVGADTTCAVFASGMLCSSQIAMLCDIGTNGELALWKEGVLYVTSTAAGPTFEGAGLTYGCQSIPGAIEKVTLHDNKLQVSTIGNLPPVGICGSGIIDAMACLLENEAIDETGYMEEEEIWLCPNVSVTQKDVRVLQLSKGAIAAGIKCLLEFTNTKVEEIQSFYIAGGFGSHINIDSAIRIGLFPAQFKQMTHTIGNAALLGAATMLLSENARQKATGIANQATCFNLGGMPEFNSHYLNEMNFPQKG